MPSIDYEKLQVKLDAILAKDYTQLSEDGVYIPFLGDDYIPENLRLWLQDRADMLSAMKNEPNIEKVQNFVDNLIYGRLCSACKLIADNVLAGVETNIGNACSADCYKYLCGIVLYKWVYIP